MFTVAAHAGLKAGDVIVNINGVHASDHRIAVSIINQATESRSEMVVEYFPHSTESMKRPWKPMARRYLTYAHAGLDIVGLAA
jgi:precorrin-2 methylase